MSNLTYSTAEGRARIYASLCALPEGKRTAAHRQEMRHLEAEFARGWSAASSHDSTTPAGRIAAYAALRALPAAERSHDHRANMLALGAAIERDRVSAKEQERISRATADRQVYHLYQLSQARVYWEQQGKRLGMSAARAYALNAAQAQRLGRKLAGAAPVTPEQLARAESYLEQNSADPRATQTTAEEIAAALAMLEAGETPPPGPAGEIAEEIVGNPMGAYRRH